MTTSEQTDKQTTTLFYIFIGMVILGMASVVGYMVYSLLFG